MKRKMKKMQKQATGLAATGIGLGIMESLYPTGASKVMKPAGTMMVGGWMMDTVKGMNVFAKKKRRR